MKIETYARTCKYIRGQRLEFVLFENKIPSQKSGADITLIILLILLEKVNKFSLFYLK